MPDSSSRDPIDRLADEFSDRLRRGDDPSIEAYCARHPELADEIREAFPALALMEQARPASVPTEPPERLGEYRILREIGRGGMDIVYEAVQESLGRHVALKVLPPGAGLAGTYLERFRREARNAARLHHTNIVPVFGTGEGSGVHFYAMQYIHGQPLDRVLDDVRRLRGSPAKPLAGTVAEQLLSGNAVTGPFLTGKPESRLSTDAGSSVLATGSEYFNAIARLGAQAADALHYAHGQGVLHRDVKPGNLLLDVQSTLWVTDFGLAKASDGVGDGENLTASGDLLGTLRYMAPERFAGACDHRADIYAVGVTLYEALTLRPAFEAGDRLQVIEQITRGTPKVPRSLDASIPADLETVVLKAMARDAADRYPSAGELAEDLRRFLSRRPILARRHSRLELMWRWAKRNPGVASLSACVAILLVAGTIASLALSNWALAEREIAQRAANDANTAARLAETEQGRADREAATAQANATQLSEALYRFATRRGVELADNGKLGEGLLWLAEATAIPNLDAESALAARRRFAMYWKYSNRMTMVDVTKAPAQFGDLKQQLARVVGQLRALRQKDDEDRAEKSPDGQRTVLLGPTGARLKSYIHKSPKLVSATIWSGTEVSFRPDSLAFNLQADDSLSIWDADLGTTLGASQSLSQSVSVEYERFGRHLVIKDLPGDETDRIAVSWDLSREGPASFSLSPNEQKPEVFAQDLFSISDDGRFLIGGVRNEQRHCGTIYRWDLRDRRALGSALTGRNDVALAISHDGARFAALGIDGRIQVLETPTGKELARSLILETEAGPGRLAFSQDDKRLHVVAANKSFHVVDTANLQPIGTAIRAAKNESILDFRFDGRRVCVRTELSINIRSTDADPAETTLTLAPTERVAFDRDWRLVAFVNSKGRVRIRDVRSGEEVAAPFSAFSEDESAFLKAQIQFSPSGDRLVMQHGEAARIWNAQGMPISPRIPVWDGIAQNLRLSPDGRMVAFETPELESRLWDMKSGQPLSPTLKQVSNDFLHYSGDRLIGRSGYSYFDTVDIAPDDRPTRDLIDLARLYSGQELDRSGTPSWIVGTERVVLFHRLKAKYPDEFRLPAKQVRDWRRQQIGRCLQTGNVSAAEQHYWWLVRELATER